MRINKSLLFLVCFGFFNQPHRSAHAYSFAKTSQKTSQKTSASGRTTHRSDFFSPEVLQEKLRGEGLIGQVHGANHTTNLYALTLREPNNFFIHKEYPLIWESEIIAAEFKSLKRHQTVRVFGDLIDNGAPITHILVTRFVIEKNHTAETDQYEYVAEAKIDELFNQTSFIGRVHAIDDRGNVLVMEYKDLVTPVFIRDAATSATIAKLFRGDKVTLDYEVKSYPDSPKHLVAKPRIANESAVKVIETVSKFHNQTVTRTGYLVKFPKSPQITSDTYAVLETDSEGSSIQWTVLNFEDMELFKKIREKMTGLWNSDTSQIKNGRNKLINMNVKVTVKGRGNVVDPGQANPQILVDALEDISRKTSP
ncbi:MAG: hypothetical protein ACK5WZ_11940 [Pseudobdellovibrionaceae bacterium]